MICKLLLLLAVILAEAGTGAAQNVVVGQSCPASGQNAIATNGAPVVCTQPAGGGALVWTAVAGGGSGVTANSPVPANQAQGPTFNVVNYGSGTINDAQHIVDGVTAGGGSKTVTSATAAFCNGGSVPCTTGRTTDVGKKIVCNVNFTTVATILSVTATTATTDTSDSGAGSNEVCVWYSKDATTAFTSALTAANGAIGTQWPNQGKTLMPQPGSVYCPEGGYAVSGRIYLAGGSGSTIAPNFIGAGRNKCIIYVLPSTVDIGDGNAVIMESNNNIGVTFRDFTIDGLKFPSAFGHPIIRMGSNHNFTMENVDVTNISSGGNFQGTVDFGFSANGQVNNVFVQGSGGTDGTNSFACGFNNAVGIVVKNITCSNHNQNLAVTNQGLRTIAGDNGIVFEGGTFDECGSASLDCNVVQFAGLANFYGSTLMVGNTGRSALNVDGTSRAYLSNVTCGIFGSTATIANCMTIASGGEVYSTMSDLRGNGATGIAISGPSSAKFFDLGGNKYRNSNNAVITDLTAANFFTNGFNGGVFPVFPLAIAATTQLGMRQVVQGVAPTFAVTGFGTGPTVTVQTGSTDAAGAALITAGTTPAATGTFTVTFSTVSGAYGTNAPVCTFTLVNGTGSWNALAQEPIIQTPTTTSVLANWSNNAVALTAASTYGFNWSCYGK